MSQPEADGAYEAELDGFPIMADAEQLQSRDLLEVLMSRFAEEVRQGQFPSIEGYTARYPDLADEIRELFPLVASLENWKGNKEVECLRLTVPKEFTLRRLGNYDIVRELGRGGMGVVFEAAHVKTGRRVAIKVLPWRFASDLPRWKSRFRREAATIARLKHRHIVRVHSFGDDEGYAYYVMQLVKGVSLDVILRRLRESADPIDLESLPLPPGSNANLKTTGQRSDLQAVLRRDSWRDFAIIGAQVALALQYAHDNGVLHNDVKPGNLLLDASGIVVVTDFGLGLAFEEGITQSDEHPVGTLRYMAPERLEGRSEPRSDVYALGATLYELITRTPAFDIADRPELFRHVQEGLFTPPRKRNREIPVELETVVLKAMSRDPEQRYPDAKALGADLLRFINGQPIRARRPGWRQRLLTWYRNRHRK